MVDRAIFLGMSGANSSMQQLNVITNNLANANTIGFRADYEAIKSDDQQNPLAMRLYPMLDRTYSDFHPGPVSYTGRDMDVALAGSGFIAVQTKEGTEAYTRAGNLEIDPKGFLVTQRGDYVLGNPGGLVLIPKAQRLSIDASGQVSVQQPGQGPKDMTVVGRMKLVELQPEQIQKGPDGLFHLVEDGSVKPSETVRLTPKSLEGSNVNTVKSMVDLIELSREFEMHARVMKSIEDNAARSNQLLNISE